MFKIYFKIKITANPKYFSAKTQEFDNSNSEKACKGSTRSERAFLSKVMFLTD